MIRYTATFLLLFSAAISLAQEPSQSLVFEERVFNFGTINEKDGKVTHTFYFRNNGTQPVEMGEVNTGCGCLVNSASKGPVKPGERSGLTITFDPSYKTGFFSKEILVFSENNQRYNRVWVEGKINATTHPVEDDYPYNFGNGLYLRFKVMAFGYLKPGAAKKMDLQFANDNNKDMQVKFVPRTKYPGLHFTSPGKIAANQKGIVSFAYNMPYFSQDDVIILLDVYVNDKKLADPLELRILNENKTASGN
ncbi:DUF1573 domain-containing protein [Terrimonas sp. NA20]|uniref:DUF1573 domain-containing protein n=1 Tax=Terrimonas ginsenosidimutans TaxID=2908004 RepID=A0ABS9KLY7_9BACT|nr:DUF1573 domain-containing protein [Terrimonas ginsenosidimutans]MCG2613337.1 DUF1573 domain-containing protein [Terrimonas ginsenosidimutans]